MGLPLIVPNLFSYNKTIVLAPENQRMDYASFIQSSYPLELVTVESPSRVRKACETIARYFQIEFSYDFIQYKADEYVDKSCDDRDRIFLVTHEFSRRDREVWGAICFRWRNYTDAEHRLALAWVWIHPFIRNKGVLKMHWKTFRFLYGDFICEPPISKAMDRFLAKQNECWCCGTSCVCPPENK